MTVIDIPNLDATDRIGRSLGAALARGDLLALIGPLGSGKTTLMKSIAAGAGVRDLRQVNSPTFVIVNEYEADRVGSGLHLFHIDAYRLRGSGDLEALGFDEMCSQGAVVIEWADRVLEALPADRLTLTLEPLDDARRRFHFQVGGAASELLAAKLAG